MLDAFARSLVLHRGRWTAGALALLVVSLVLGSRLSLRYQTADFLPRGAPPPMILPDGAGADRIVVVLEADRPIMAAEAGPVLDSLATALTRIPGVGRVTHRLPTSLEHYLQEGALSRLLLYFGPDELDSIGSHLSLDYIQRALLHRGAPIVRSPLALAIGIEHTDPLGVIGPAAAKLRSVNGFNRIKLAGGYFAVPDQQDFFLTVEPARNLATIDSARAMVREIDAALSTVRRMPSLERTLRNKRLFALGRPVAVVQGFSLALGDVQRVGVASTVVVLLLLMLFLRRPLTPLFILGTVFYGVSLTAGMAYLVFQSVSLLGWVFIALLIGFGDEFALYIIAHYWLSAEPGATRAEALASALRRPGPGILLGGLTSAGAFFSLIALSYPVMRQLAWLSTIGLLLILGCSFTVLPLALSYTSPGRDASSRWYRWSGFAHRQGQRGKLAWIAGWTALVLISLALARNIRYELHPWKLAVRGVPVTRELDRIAQRLGASFTPILMVSRGATAEAALGADRAAVTQLEAIKGQAGVAGIISLSRWIPSPEQQALDLRYLKRHADLFSAARFKREFSAVAARMDHPDTLLTGRYLALVSRSLTPHPQTVTADTLRHLGLGGFVDRLLVRRGPDYLAISEVYLTRVAWADGAVEGFNGAVNHAAGAELRRAVFVGDALRGATHADTLKHDMLRATALALGITLLVLIIRFRRVDLVVICLIPLLCGIAATIGLMALFGIQLNMLTLAAAPLILGLGSDDGIHIMDRLERGETAGDVLAATSAPMTITTLTTIAGFACAGLARFPDVRAMGLIASWGLLVCLTASLQLVPMCYSMVRGDRS